MPHIQAQLEIQVKRGLLPIHWSEAHPQFVLTDTHHPTGQVITNALARLDKTQAWLAEQCGVSDQAVSLWIRTGKVGREKAVLAAKALQIPVGSLISDEDPLAGAIGEVIATMNNEGRQLAFDFLAYLLEKRPTIYDDGALARRYLGMIERFQADMGKRQSDG